jgi:hypothetical protein
MKKFTTLLILITFTILNVHSQDPELSKPVFPRYNVGFGLGLDYGGFGSRLTVLVSERLEFFGALGYNLLGPGINAGVDLRLLPKSIICPYFGVMYGYNAFVKIKGAEMYNQTYYGPSWNLGFEFWSRRNPNFFNLELLVPIRSTEYHDDIKSLKNNSSINLTSVPPPIAISIGYHFSF